EAEIEAEAEAVAESEAEPVSLTEAEPTEVVEAAEEIAAAAADLDAASDELDAAQADLAEAEEQLEIAEEAALDAAVAEAIIAAEAAAAVDAVAMAHAEAEGGVLLAALAPLRPGDVAEGSIAVWKSEAVAAFREQLRDIQARFVDEPEEAVAQVRALVSDAVHTLADSLLAQQLGGIDLPEHADTESLRVALRQYREFLDRILAL